MLTPEEFYDDLAEDYDAMTQFAVRLEKEKRILAGVLELLSARHAIDMGCGTGVHAVALAQLGVEVTGVDVSTRMLERARAHAGRHATVDSAPVHFRQGDFLAPLPTASTDLLFCFGNSLSHLPSGGALAEVLAHWRHLLVPGGRVLIQLLNYRDILRHRERIVSIRRESETTIVRFYDFLDDALRFNILTITDDDDGPSHSLRSTRLSPFTDEDILEAADSGGFTSVETYADLEFNPFEDESRNLVAVLG